MTVKFTEIDNNLSIIVQGPLMPHNVVEIANNCQHWRDLFPNAEIILSLSINDVIERARPRGNSNIGRYTLSERHKPNILSETAVAVLDKVCDYIVLADPSLPLPSIKPNDGPNHSSYMINAAKAGLKIASKRYVLRIRNDALFLDKSFISFYLTKAFLPRRFRHILTQRVMICNLFTVNPYGLERLPFHYSDWFNFGLLCDVRKIWDVPLMSFQDASYYDVNHHKEDSSPREKLFRARIGVEQHVYTSFLRKMKYPFELAYHNDLTSRDESLKILENDFLIGDALPLKLIIQKSSDYINFDWIDDVCINHKQWNALRTVAPHQYKTVLSSQHKPSSDISLHEAPEPHSENNLSPSIQKGLLLSLYKIVLSKKMKRKFNEDPVRFFSDSHNPLAQFVFRVSYK